jgi:hypothetical protein|tara:strand:- start:1798 stop:2337 length:540 start_codon:yes stop_codon:yes gene_type:complete
VSKLLVTLSELGAPRVIAQATFYLFIGLLMAYLSTSPTYQYADDTAVELKLVIRHSGLFIGECRPISEAEAGKLRPNMRAPQVCPREKSSMNVSLAVNDAPFHEGVIKPAGLHNDGVLALYRHFTLVAGKISVRLAIENGKDGLRVFEQVIDANPADVLLLQYDDAGFRFSKAAERGAG